MFSSIDAHRLDDGTPREGLLLTGCRGKIRQIRGVDQLTDTSFHQHQTINYLILSLSLAVT
jgi:hypothetical protein